MDYVSTYDVDFELRSALARDQSTEKASSTLNITTSKPTGKGTTVDKPICQLCETIGHTARTCGKIQNYVEAAETAYAKLKEKSKDKKAEKSSKVSFKVNLIAREQRERSCTILQVEVAEDEFDMVYDTAAAKSTTHDDKCV